MDGKLIVAELFGGRTHRLVRQQWYPVAMEQAYGFFENPGNLVLITPPWLKFQIAGMTPPSMGQGTLIDYSIRLNGLPMGWRTLIEQWLPGRKFVDVQLAGPYKLWRHTHAFTPTAGGVLVTDVVLYKLPFGVLGNLVHAIIVRRQLRAIFDFRAKKTAELLSAGTVFASTPKQPDQLHVTRPLRSSSERPESVLERLRCVRLGG